VMTGRMHRHKDYPTLLEAARILSHEEPDGWRFVAIGSGDDRDALMSSCRDLIEASVVSFPEAGQEVLKFVGSSNVGVLLTNVVHHSEGIPNSVMEYMACGLPTVCTDDGGTPELVLEGETGLLVPPDDVDALVRQLRFLRENPEIARSMGEAGRERIASAFTVEALVSGTLAAYELAERRHPAEKPER